MDEKLAKMWEELPEDVRVSVRRAALRAEVSVAEMVAQWIVEKSAVIADEQKEVGS